MDPSVAAIVGLVVGLLIGVVGVFTLLRGRLVSAEAEARSTREGLSAAQTEAARLQERVAGMESLQSDLATTRTSLDERAAALSEALQKIARHETEIAERDQSYAEREKQIREVFDSMSREALSQNTKDLIQQNEQLLKNIKEKVDQEDLDRRRHIQNTLEPFAERLKDLEKLNRELDQKRAEDASGLKENLQALTTMQQKVEVETNRLVKSLQNPGQAGAWGEMVLEQVLEMGGLQKGINYHLQVHEQGDEGNQRPDAVIDLPGGRQIAIDSKAPMDAYIEAQSDTIDQKQRDLLLGNFAHRVHGHCTQLSKRSYTDKANRFDFVFLFVPSEGAYRAAHEARPTLTEEALGMSVFVASPGNLIAFLRAVSQGWRQEELSRNAQEIQKQATQIYESLGILAAKLSALSDKLKSTEKAHNEVLSTFNSRLLPRSREMNRLGMQVKNVKAIEPVERVNLELAEPKPEALAIPLPSNEVLTLDFDEGYDEEAEEEETSPATLD